MNNIERIKMVKAMEYIVRNINDEGVFMDWLYSGVADGDIEYGNLDVTIEDANGENDMDYYIRDAEFKDLMGLFLRLMRRAEKSGGLYCDGVVS